METNGFVAAGTCTDQVSLQTDFKLALLQRGLQESMGDGKWAQLQKLVVSFSVNKAAPSSLKVAAFFKLLGL